MAQAAHQKEESRRTSSTEKSQARKIRIAMQMVQAGDLRGAKRVLQNGPASSPSVLAMLGAIAIRMQRYSEALEYLRHAVQLETNHDARIQTLIATCYLGLGKVAAARRTLLSVVDQPAPPPDAFYYLALIGRRDGRDDSDVVAMLQHCADRDPNHGNAHFEAGTMLFDMGKVDKAFGYLSRAADLFVHDPAAQHNLALCALQLGRFDVAERHALCGWELAPVDPVFSLLLAVCALERNDRDSALTHLRHVCSVSPTYQALCIQILTSTSQGCIPLSTGAMSRLLLDTGDVRARSEPLLDLSRPLGSTQPTGELEDAESETSSRRDRGN